MKNKTLREEMIASINEQLVDIYGFEFSPLSCTREQAAQFTSIVDSTLEDIMEANNWEETEETDILSDLSEEYDFNWESWAAFEAQREQTEEQTKDMYTINFFSPIHHPSLDYITHTESKVIFSAPTYSEAAEWLSKYHTDQQLGYDCLEEYWCDWDHMVSHQPQFIGTGSRSSCDPAFSETAPILPPPF